MNVFISYSAADKRLMDALVYLLQDRGMTTTKLSDSSVGESIHEALVTGIRNADVVVALLTEQSPRVLFELGVAIGAGLPVIVGATASESLISGLQALPYVRLSGNHEADVIAIAHRLAALNPPKREQDVVGAEPLKLLSRSSPLRREDVEALDYRGFEVFVGGWLRKQGFTVIENASDAKPGYDFVAEFPDDKTKFLVEVKKYSSQNRVSIDVVLRLLGAMRAYGVPHALIVSTSGFTAAAQDLAKSSGVSLLTLEELLTSDLSRLRQSAGAARTGA